MSLLDLAKRLRADQQARKPESLRLLRQQQYEDLTADIATPEDIDALRWAVERQGPAVLSEVLALDGDCANLAYAEAPEAEFRAAVVRFVNRVGELRRVYREAIEAS